MSNVEQDDRAAAATMLRANVSRSQIRALRQIALKRQTTMQQIVGDLITEYLKTNGYPEEGA